MKTSIQYIKEKLTGLYPAEEIDGFVRIIINHQLGLSFTDMILQKNSIIKEEERKKIKDITARLKKYEPIQYILGETEFCDLNLHVAPGVLIPRPETEELIDWVLKSDMSGKSKIIDIGTGSGCIALAIKKRLPEADVSGIDISEKALRIAQKNAGKNNLSVDFKKTDILNWEKRQWNAFNVVISNPPYVCESEKKQMQTNVLDYEPGLALFVNDDDPLLFYRTIAKFAKQYLTKNGFLFFEINENLGKETKILLTHLGFGDVELRKDIEGKNRMIRCRQI